MAEQVSALLVHSPDDTFHDLMGVLRTLGIKVVHAGNCREASLLMKKDIGIELVFAGTGFKDGGWADVLEIAQESRNCPPVIIVSRMVDAGLYLEVLARGAFDFVTPPFLTSDLAHIVRSAIYKELVNMKQSLIAPPAAQA